VTGLNADEPQVPAITGRRLGIPQEARQFQGERAGIVTRVIANTIDFVLVAAVLLGAYVGWVALKFLWSPANFNWPTPKFLNLLIAGGAVLIFYLWISWASTGRTIGDHVMGLRVVSYRGRLMKWSGALLRSLFCAVFPIGLFWAIVSRQNRSVQDVVLRTSVIYDWQIQGTALGRESSRSTQEPTAG
jgi:uncharacterized RDD family membrane protein YckC